MISKKELEHLAHLARLNFSEKELEKFSQDLNSIIDFVQKLDQVDTEGVEETAQVTGLENISRTDEIKVFNQEDALLDCSPQKLEQHSIKIPKIM